MAESERYRRYTAAMDQYQALKASDPEAAREYAGRPDVQALFDEYAPKGPSRDFWDFHYANIPPGRISSELYQDPLITFIMNPAYRTLLVPEAYAAALEVEKAWRVAHPEVPGDPKEWAIVRQITKKYWALKDAGSTNEASALWKYFAPLLEKYYPSEARVTAPRGGGGGGRRAAAPAVPTATWSSWRTWRRWPRIRYYPRR